LAARICSLTVAGSEFALGICLANDMLPSFVAASLAPLSVIGAFVAIRMHEHHEQRSAHAE
jgi:hypothetical protein